MSNAPYVTLTADRLNALPIDAREELLAWLADADLNADVVARITLSANPTDKTSVFVAEVEPDETSPFIGHTRMLAPGRIAALPTRLREQFEPCADLL